MSAEGRDDRGLSLLVERIASLPDALRALACMPNPPLALGTERKIRRFVTTGIGSSRAHARFLADRLGGQGLGLWVEALTTSSLAAASAETVDDALIVFSQGLAPTMRPLLSASQRWAGRVLVTAAREGSGAPGDVRRALEEFRNAGGIVRTIPGENEFGTLVRVVGPILGYLECLRLVEAVAAAHSLPAPAPLDVERIVASVRGASARVERILEGAGLRSLEPLSRGLAFVAHGGYGELAMNLQYKVLEGMLLPWPPVWDLLEFAHGPFQQAYAQPMTLFALAHGGDRNEARLLERLRGMLVPERHRLVVLESTLPGPLAIFEHEALLDALLVRFLGERPIDQANWPGRGRDAPLYECTDWIVANTGSEYFSTGNRDAVGKSTLTPFSRLAWPELEQAVRSGRTTVVVPLGSTEQHGPHLPLVTDTIIGDALAERFCARVPEAIRLPTIALGCSSEHLGFPGTLTLRADTLAAVLADVLESLAACGFEKAFVFSAHGGNLAILARALPELRRAAAPLEVVAFTDLDRLTGALHREAASDGVAAEIAGHHAGEAETSIVLALDSGLVRRELTVPGFVEPTTDPQGLFYPRLRSSAPTGVVGDPTRADAARGMRYLVAWTDLLIGAYRGEKNER